MIKRTLEISREGAHLSIRNRQLMVTPHDRREEGARSFPCEDIGIICVDHPRTTFSSQALVELMTNGAVVALCGSRHLPVGLLLPLTTHTEVVQRLQDQIAVQPVRRKQLWKQIVQAKIRAQAVNLEEPGARAHLSAMARRVRSGDAGNMEAQAAKFYWTNFLGNGAPFHRDTAGYDSLNSMLNYGYAVMRAAVARALVLAGFQVALGLHHTNRSNPFCLADDFIEPLRPIVDRRARALYREGREELDQRTKADLLALLSVTVKMGGTIGPLSVVLHRVTGAFGRCLTDRSAATEFPVWADADPLAEPQPEAYPSRGPRA